MSEPIYDYKAPVPDEVKKTLNDIAKVIGPQMPKGYGFALLIFSFGPNGTMSYISNGDRNDMVKALREAASMLQGS